jgi:hypothetical protein
MALSTSTDTLAVGASRTFNLSPGSALTLVAPPNCRVTVTETPNTVSASGVGGNTSRTHFLQLGQTVTYGPYAMGGTVVVANASNSGGAVTWVRSDAIVAESASGSVSLVSGDGKVRTIGDLSFPARSAVAAGGMAPPQNWGGKIVAADYSISSGSPTVTVETRNGRECLKIVTGSGVTANVDLILTGDVSWYGRAIVEIEGARTAGVNQISLLVSPDSFTNFAQNTFTTLTTPLNNPAEPGGIYGFRVDGQVTSGATSYQFTGNGAAWSVSTPTLDGATATVNRIRFRVIPIAATVATVYVYGVSLGPPRKKGRIIVTADDGYKSFVQAGFPLFAARNIPVTVSVIGHLMDNRADVANYMQWDDVRNIVAAGGQAVAHGPVLSSAAGNLITNYTTNAQRVADMEAARDYIQANGCGTPFFDRCYVWPQGNFQTATDDVTLLDAAIAAGFTVGRSATPSINQRYDFSAMSKYQRLVLPIIGHIYAGGSEAANITAITGAISAAATDRSDIILMLHKVVKNAATPDAIGITVGNLATIADAIQTAVDAGTMTAGVLSDLATPDSWMR